MAEKRRTGECETGVENVDHVFGSVRESTSFRVLLVDVQGCERQQPLTQSEKEVIGRGVYALESRG